MPSLLPSVSIRRRNVGERSWPLVIAAFIVGTSERTRAILVAPWSARAAPCTTSADATTIDQTTAVLRQLTEKRMDMVPALAVAPAEKRKACSKASLPLKAERNVEMGHVVENRRKSTQPARTHR
jgi:hypothetical protein